jgi:diguanylate cyclase (GGDEF)-like protein
MPGETAFETTVAGKRLRQKVILALALSSALPLLILIYLVHGYVVPRLAPSDATNYLGVQSLLIFTVLSMIAGGFMIWNIGRVATAIVELMATAPTAGGLERSADDPGALRTNVSKMFETIEHQATEINSFATRLDAAYRELESTNSRLKETSFKDEVTGLYNRRFFTIRLDEEISRHRRFTHPVSMVLLDLDGFKAVNDDLGHAVGDDTLRDVARILAKHSRGINVVSRYGGDEFAVLLVETSKAGAVLYAERIREVIAKFRFAHGKPVTASLGIASLPDDDVSTAEDLFKLADEALYAAKRAGKNQVAVCDPAAGQKG